MPLIPFCLSAVPAEDIPLIPFCLPAEGHAFNSFCFQYLQKDMPARYEADPELPPASRLPTSSTAPRRWRSKWRHLYSTKPLQKYFEQITDNTASKFRQMSKKCGKYNRTSFGWLPYWTTVEPSYGGHSFGGSLHKKGTFLWRPRSDFTPIQISTTFSIPLGDTSLLRPS